MGVAEDRLEIMDQLYRYCRSVDRLDVPLGHAVFHPEARARFPSFEGTGREWIDHICVEHLNHLHHSHQVTNVIIEVEGDRAASESYVFATLQASEGGRIVQRQFWARYLDAWSRRDGRWAIDERDCVVDFSMIGEVTPIDMPTTAGATAKTHPTDCSRILDVSPPDQCFVRHALARLGDADCRALPRRRGDGRLCG